MAGRPRQGSRAGPQEVATALILTSASALRAAGHPGNGRGASWEFRDHRGAEQPGSHQAARGRAVCGTSSLLVPAQHPRLAGHGRFLPHREWVQAGPA